MHSGLRSGFRLTALICALIAGGTNRIHAEPPPPVAPNVHGKVLDQSRTPIPGATVSAAQTGKLVNASTYAGEAGEFSLFLPAGTYTLRVAADGFKDVTQELTVPVTSGSALEVLLPVASRQEAVTVSDTFNYQVLTSSSTKTATPLRDVPQSIAVVTQDLIHDQAMQNMADVVRYIPGITMAQGEGHRDAPVIRGNATTADFYLNGVRDDVQYYRDLYNVERVEAVKGANALTFGRGGGGGVINRVSKQAQFFPFREFNLLGGTFGNRRVSSDFEQPLTDKVSLRFNGMYENSDSFRHFVNLERYGIAPSLSIRPTDRTRINVNYEYFDDGRVVDRGIPSFAGRPSAAHRSTFFGNPDESYATTGVHVGSVTLEQQLGRVNLRNNTLVGDYDKFYQNIFAGAVNATQTMVALSGYNNGTERRNVFNQTDVTGVLATGGLRHTVLMGSEFGRQRSDNLRMTAFFNNTATSINVPFLDPVTRGPVTFRPGATDADNHATTDVASVYVQDQVEINRYIQVVGGIRYDRFTIDFHNNRQPENLKRTDNMLSPRAGLVLKPFAALSLYGSYGVTYLPSSGDQFSSLTATTQTLKPEKFTNYEIGAKWDVNRSLAVTTAVYRLDRTNTTARDPNDPSRTIQTGRQRTDGFELGLNGNITRKWRMVGGYAYQDAFISSATTAAVQGAQIALVPHHTLSLWNNYQVAPRFGGGLGLIHQADMFAGIDNIVTLPSFVRADLAAYYTLTEAVRLQANVENLFDRTYYPTAHSNNNITPGYARTVRIGLIARF